MSLGSAPDGEPLLQFAAAPEPLGLPDRQVIHPVTSQQKRSDSHRTATTNLVPLTQDVATLASSVLGAYGSSESGASEVRLSPDARLVYELCVLSDKFC